MPTPTFDRFDASRKCVKCGHDDISAQFEEASEYGHYPCHVTCEHIHRRCRRCGYAWIELPLDAQGADDETALAGH